MATIKRGISSDPPVFESPNIPDSTVKLYRLKSRKHPGNGNKPHFVGGVLIPPLTKGMLRSLGTPSCGSSQQAAGQIKFSEGKLRIIRLCAAS